MDDKLNQQKEGQDRFQEEVEKALNLDETRLGDGWKLEKQNLDPDEIAKYR